MSTTTAPVPTEEFVSQTLAAYHVVENRIYHVATRVQRLRDELQSGYSPPTKLAYDLLTVCSIAEAVIVSFYAHSNTHYIEFPREYLWQDNFEEHERTAIAARRAARAAADEAQREALRQANEAEQRATYERLREKFDPNWRIHSPDLQQTVAERLCARLLADETER